MIDAKPFDVVTLKDHTSFYRAYSLPEGHPGGSFIFACLYADEVRYSAFVEVDEIKAAFMFEFPLPKKED